MLGTRSRTIALPLIALFAGTASAIAIAAQAGLSFCSARLAIPLPGDAPGSGDDVLLICPCVLVLIVASALLAAAAIAVVWRDPHRALTGRGIVQALASLPPVRTAALLSGLGAAAVGFMFAVDRAAPPAWPVCGMLGALLVAGSLVAAALSIAAGRLALVFGRRLILAIATAIARTRAAAPALVERLVGSVARTRAASPLAAGHGLRAPPALLR